ncbi:hypothetical protein ACHAXH_000189, partial [Discostella pseudostelligera]
MMKNNLTFPYKDYQPPPTPSVFTPITNRNILPYRNTHVIIDHRAFHSTTTSLAPKKRRASASSARKKKQRDAIKEQKAKQRAVSKREERVKLNVPQQQGRQRQKQNHPTQQQQHNRPTSIPDPIPKQQKKDSKEVPRAFLTQTASPYVYIAKCAVMDEISGEMYVDPRTLFSEIVNTNKKKQKDVSTTSTKRTKQVHHHRNLPHTFKNTHLHYFPPSSFPNFEPPSDGRTPEVAFLGRSNTGKSSLINALSSTILGSSGTHLHSTSSSSSSGGGELARTSKRPGRTQTINYFGLIPNNNHHHETTVSYKQSKLYLIDLPGFGYASAPDESVDEWQKKTQEFLISRASTSSSTLSSSSSSSYSSLSSAKRPPSPPMKRLYLLLDSRLSDPTLLDMTVMGWCDEYAIPYTTILTKVDASSRSQCVKLTNQLCMRYHSLYHLAASAASGSTEAEMEAEESGGGEVEEGGGGGGEVYMDPVVYWTSAKDELGMEELLLSIENNMFASESDEDDDDEGFEYVDEYEYDDAEDGSDVDDEDSDYEYESTDDDNVQ